MGTINYMTSDYITLGLKPYDIYENEQDEYFMEEMKLLAEEDNKSIEQEINDYFSNCYEEDYYNIKNCLKKYDFNFYHITIENGYYEGFSINIENNFSIAYDDYIDKREAQKEITQIKHFLIDCANCGLVQCFPSWGTKYLNYYDTIEGINKAIKEMREEAKNTPTWAQYERG